MMMLRANFQLLNRILTILLHLCCSSIWPRGPRLAHDSTFMRSAQSCDVFAGKCCCSSKHLHKDYYPFFTSYLVLSIPIQRNPTLNKYFSDCSISTKVLLSTRRVPTLRANSGTSIAIDRICDYTKETVSGFAK